jgi:hypothetical protein
MIRKLGTSDFGITNIGDERTIIHPLDTKVTILVLYYTDKCQYCPGALEALYELDGRTRHIALGSVNVGIYSQIAISSRHTTTPIIQVPTFILYRPNEMPLEYSGERNSKSILNALFPHQSTSQVHGYDSIESTTNTADTQPMLNDIAKSTNKSCYLTFTSKIDPKRQ